VAFFGFSQNRRSEKINSKLRARRRSEPNQDNSLHEFQCYIPPIINEVKPSEDFDYFGVNSNTFFCLA
jgi:hypothetical protein